MTDKRLSDRCACGFDVRWRQQRPERWDRAHAVHHGRWRRGVNVTPRGLWAAFDIAAEIYRRECRWDFAPGYCWPGPKECEVIDSRLIGFALGSDRDGRHFLEHLWVCADRRRTGVATGMVRRLVTRAGEPLLVGHTTQNGMAWSKAAREDRLICFPDSLGDERMPREA